MSHFVVLVIAQKRGHVDDLLEPFSENMEVEEYDRECHCGESRAIRKVRTQVDEQVGTIQSFRESFNEKYAPKNMSDEDKLSWMFSEESDELWEKHIKPYNDLEAKLMAEADKSPDQDCEECGGTGFYKSTYNPHSKWDWYQVGGRWDGMYGKDNVIKVGELKGQTDKYPFAILTPDGVWHERGDMGWWGNVRNPSPKEEWHKEIEGIIAKYADYLGVGVDCHI